MSTVPSRRARLAARSAAPSPAVAGFRPAAIAVAAAFALGAHAQSVPVGAVHGTATFDRNGNNLLVTTTNGAGNRSVINWQTFGVPGGSTTYFQQPDAASTSINRVTGGVRSDIFGTLGSNGRLVLVNPSGIAIGAGAMVDTAGFTASTLNLSQDDAIAGRLLFQGGTAGITVGEGAKILAHNGDIVLVGSQVQVERNAVVRADGATILAAGEKVEITGRGLEGIRLQVQSGNQAVNLGTLQGDAVGIFAETLKHSGLVQAQAVTAQGGKVVLQAIGGDNLVDGSVVASAQGGKGGSIDLLGNRVGLLAGASVDASGANGGGAIRIGGDYQGGNPDVPNAQAVYVDGAASVKADATGQGDGGRVIVWSDGVTRMRGTISARGGASGGDGGFAEVSGKQELVYSGSTDLRAAMGRVGTLLLDPQDITIYHTGDTLYTQDYIAIGNVSGGADFTYTGGPSFMSDGQVNAQLASSNLTITTKHDPARYPPPGPSSAPISDSGSGGQITMTVDADIFWSTPNKLEMLADQGMAINGRITGDNQNASLALTAKNGSIVMDPSSTLQTGGDMTMTASGDINVSYLHTGAISSSGNGWNAGNVTLTAGGSVTGNGSIYSYGDYKAGGDAGKGGDITVQAGGGIALSQIYAQGGYASEFTSTATPAPSPIPPGKGGNGGAVKLTAGGAIAVDRIDASAGGSAGGTAFPAGGTAGTAGSIDIQAGGDVSLGQLEASGNYGTAGSAGGTVRIKTPGNVRFEEIFASGGYSYSPTKAGKGGVVAVDAGGSILMTPFEGGDAVNAEGGYGGSGTGAAGGDGGSISLKAGGSIDVALQAGEVVLATLPPAHVSASGGTGGSSNTLGGKGGAGGSLVMEAGQPLVLDGSLVLAAWGGDGGDVATTGSGNGGTGGAGGTVDLRSGNPVVLRGAFVFAGGGDGGLASDGVTAGASGAIGTFQASGSSVEVEDNFLLDGNWTNNSVVNLRGTSSVFGTGVFKNASDVNLYDTTYLAMASVENAGNFRTFGSQVGATLTKNTGLVEVNGGSTFDAPSFFTNAGTVVVNGTIDIGSSATTAPPVPTAPTVPLLSAAIGPGAVFTNQASGTIAGNGTMNVDAGIGTVDNFGTLAPGGVGAVGALNINGNLAMEAGSTYAADIVNTGNHDTVVVSGSALGGGQFAVTYQPATFFLQGQSFRMVRSGVLVGGSLPPVNQAQLASAFSGNDVLLVAAADYPGGVSPIVQSAVTEGVSQVATFADLFVKMSEDQEKKRIGKDDIVITDTACTR
jgi:filamentous hemagglutinin family protein